MTDQSFLAYAKAVSLFPSTPLDQVPVDKKSAAFISAKTLSLPGSGILTADNRLARDFADIGAPVSALLAGYAAAQWQRFPMGVSVLHMTSGATAPAATVAELDSKPVVSVSTASTRLLPTKVASIEVVTQEALKATNGDLQAFVQQALASGVAAGADQSMIATLVAHGGQTSAGTLADPAPALRTALVDLWRSASQRLVWIASPTAAAAIAGSMGREDTVTTGPIGTAMGFPLYVSNGLQPGQIALVSASEVAVALEDLDVRTANHADITDAEGALLHLWQQNLAAVRVELSFAVAPLVAEPVIHVVTLA